LSMNQLVMLKSGLFNDMPKLTSLNLTRNKISGNDAQKTI
jgi:hypothetical protein